MNLLHLLQPMGGLFTFSYTQQPANGEPRFFVRSVSLGDLRQVWSEKDSRTSTDTLRGFGTGADETSAMSIAVAEGLERYSCASIEGVDIVSASAEQLGSDALDLNLIPKCSNAELLNPKCPLLLPDKHKSIRWVKGLSVLSGRSTFIPAIMVYSHLKYASHSERFWIPISTGCAAHTSYEAALYASISELCERDSISILWLQQLGLPKLEVKGSSEEMAIHLDYLQRSSPDLSHLFFDATTDLAVPTVYGIQRAPFNKLAATLVSCATGVTMAQAFCKVVRDMAFFRTAFEKPHRIPSEVDDFSDLMHGASYMARAEHSSAFEFLTFSDRSVHVEADREQKSIGEALSALICKLDSLDYDLYVVDLTTDEARKSGMVVLRAIIPQLQPLSFNYRAKYLGHPRLYRAPSAMGYQTKPEAALNRWPQPFA